MPASASARCTSSRLALSVLTRRSSGAGSSSACDQRPELVAQLLAAAAPASQSGRLWRSLSGSVARSMAADLRPATAARAASSAPRRKASLPCQARIASRRSSAPAAALRQVLEQQPLAQHGVGGLGQRVALARAQRAVLAEEGRHHAVGRRVELQHRAQQFGGEVEQGVRVHRRLSGAPHRSAGSSCDAPPAWRTTPPLDAQPALDEPAHRPRVDHVLGGQHARGQRVARRRPARTGTTACSDDRAVVEFGRHEVHRGAGQPCSRPRARAGACAGPGTPAAATGGC